jgi:hypothetical protein
VKVQVWRGVAWAEREREKGQTQKGDRGTQGRDLRQGRAPMAVAGMPTSWNLWWAGVGV